MLLLQAVYREGVVVVAGVTVQASPAVPPGGTGGGRGYGAGEDIINRGPDSGDNFTQRGSSCIVAGVTMQPISPT